MISNFFQLITTPEVEISGENKLKCINKKITLLRKNQ
jgi:hypothetical protein